MHVENGMRADLLTARWRKSSASNPSGSCVEIAELPGGRIAVRNSRDKTGPALIYPRTELAGFLRGVKNGEFDALLTRASLPVAAIARCPRRNGAGTLFADTALPSPGRAGVLCTGHPAGGSLSRVRDKTLMSRDL